MNHALKLNEFFVEGENQDLSHVLLHIIQPSTPEEETEKGYFFTICEINHGDKEDVLNLQNLADRIENEYYENPEVEDKNTLEEILNKVNSEGFDLSGHKAELTCLVGALKKDRLVFSFCGQAQALLFYKDKHGQYRKMDLVAENEDEENDENKLFSQIIEGQMSTADYFFGGTAHIVNCFNHDRIQKIITGDRSTEQSAEHFEKVLSGIKNGYSYGGLIVHLEPRIAAKTAIHPENEQKTIFDAEENTARTLSPSLFGNLNKKVKDMIKIKEPKNEIPYKPENQAAIKQAHLKTRSSQGNKGEPLWKNILKILFTIFKYIGTGIYLFFFLLAKIVVNIGRWAVMLFIAAFNIKNRRRAILEAWRDGFRRFVRRLKELPTITKILGLAAIIIFLVFAGSILYLRSEKQKEEIRKVYNEQFQTIRNKVDSAESIDIYGDEVGAKKQALEAKDALSQFTCAETDAILCQELDDRLEKLLQKFRRMSEVETQTIVDWSNNNPAPEKFIKINTKILGFSANTSTVLVFDTLTKNNVIIQAAENGFAGFINGAVPKENDYAIFFSNDQKNIAIFNPENDSLKKGILSITESNLIAAGSIYNRRLYSLDISSGQILRHDAIKDGFGPGKIWLKQENSSLRQGVSLTIDGDIFALKDNGEISKFNQGEVALFNLEEIDPILDSGNEIQTYTDMTYLYVIDAKNKRLVVFDKNGKFIKQFTSENFNSPTALDVDEKTGTALILDSGRVFEVKLD